MSALHVGTLSSAAHEALGHHALLAAREGFYLAGETGLALQLGHRRSVDFDWFRGDDFEPLELAGSLVEGGVPFAVSSTARATLHGVVGGVRVSFISFHYALLEPPLPCELGFELARPLDIGAMKLSAVAQRGARKDFFDLVALGRAGFDLGKLLAAYQQRFAIRDIGHVLTALTYFDDAERDREPILDSRDDWEAVKRTIRGWVRELAGS